MTTSPPDSAAARPRLRLGAAVLFHDAQGRVLVVEPTHQGDSEVPAGAVVPGESPWDAAARAVKEDLALALRPGRLLAVDWLPPRDGRAEGLVFVFDGGPLTAEDEAAIVLRAELRSWRWCTTAEAAECLPSLLDRRAAGAQQAAATGGTAYLENGYARG